jgi:hypothetical protein
MIMRKDGLVRITTISTVAAFTLVALMIVGCAKGTDLPGRAEALTAMENAGFKFDKTLQSTQYGDSSSTIIVTGPMKGPKILGGEIPPDNQTTYTKYSQAVVKLIDGRWVVTEASLK